MVVSLVTKAMRLALNGTVSLDHGILPAVAHLPFDMDAAVKAYTHALVEIGLVQSKEDFKYWLPLT